MLRLRHLARHLHSQVTGAGDGAQKQPQTWDYGGDVGVERWEFGQKEWCEATAGHACRLLHSAAESGQLDLSQ